MKLESLIKKVEYHYVNKDLTTKNFPVPEKIQTKDWKIIYLEKTITSQQALDMIKKEGYRPANVYELAQWISTNKNELKPYQWLVALGQTFEVADGDHGVPYVFCYSDGGFRFCLGYFEGVRGGDCAFLCFCDSNLKSSNHLSLESAIALVRKEGYVIYKEIT